MFANHVHRLSRDDAHGPHDFVLLSVVDTSGDDELRLEIEGTEGERPFVGMFSAADLAAASSPDSPLSPDSWLRVLRTLLLHADPPPDIPAIELALTVSLTPSPAPSKPSKASKKTPLQLTFRQLSPEHTLGRLTIPCVPTHEVDTLSWVSSAVSRADQLALHLKSASERADAGEASVSLLEKQLADAVRDKDEAEDKMLRSFVAVLNAKKAKIRELQQAMAKLRVDGGLVGGGASVKAEDPDVEMASGAESPRKAVSSRKGKRKLDDIEPAEKARVVQRATDEDDDSDSGFEPMRELDHGSDRDEEDDADNGPKDTTDDSEEDTPPPARRGIGKLGGSRAGGEGAGQDKPRTKGIGKLGGLGGKTSRTDNRDEEDEDDGDLGMGMHDRDQVDVDKPGAEPSSPQAANQPSTRSRAGRGKPAVSHAVAEPDSASSSDGFDAPPARTTRAQPKHTEPPPPPARKLPFEQTGAAKSAEKPPSQSQSRSQASGGRSEMAERDGQSGQSHVKSSGAEHNDRVTEEPERGDEDDEETSDDEL